MASICNSPSVLTDASASLPRLPEDTVPLIIGCTGHQDLPEDEKSRQRLRGLVGKFFDEVYKVYIKPWWGTLPIVPGAVADLLAAPLRRCNKTPLALLSGLNPGADQMVAEIAREKNIPLILVLPLPEDQYRQYLAGDPGRTGNEQFLEQAAMIVGLPLPAGVTLADFCTKNEVRRQQATRVSCFIAQHNQILLALWDGYLTQEPGTPGQVVHFQRWGLPLEELPVQDFLNEPEGGLIRHIVAPRAGPVKVVGVAFAEKWLVPGSNEPESAPISRSLYELTYSNLNAYNWDVTRLAERLKETQQKTRDWLLSETDVQTLPANLQGWARRLVDRHVVADSLAQYYQRWTRAALIVLFAFAFAATYLLYLSYIRANEHWARLLYPLSVAVVGAVYITALCLRWQNKYLDYRGLAEALRVQLFWRVAGLRDYVADHYLPIQCSDVRWLRIAARTATWLEDDTATSAAAAGPPPWSYLQNRWIEGQKDYFNKRVNRLKHYLLEFHLAAWFLMGVGFLWTLCRFLGFFWPDLAPESFFESLCQGRELPARLINIFVGMGFIAGALLLAYVKTLGLADHLKQYRRMYHVHRQATYRFNQLKDRGDHAGIQELVRQLGQEALTENAPWILLHRERRIEVPR